MAEFAIDMPHNGGQMVRMARSKTFPQTDHPQRTSTGQGNDRQGFSSILSFPATWYSSDNAIHQEGCSSVPSSPTQLDEGLASYQQPDAGDASSENSDHPQRPFTGQDVEIRCVPLVQAAMKGDWPAAKPILDANPHYVRAPITKERATVLHIAVVAQRTTFIRKLLQRMKPEDLELKTEPGFTALHTAAQSGNVRIARQLVQINRNPLTILDVGEDTPITVAAYLGHRNMVSHLLSENFLPQLSELKRNELFLHTIYNDLYDTALEILNGDPNIATANTEWWKTALDILSDKPFAIGSERQLSFWKRLLKYSGFNGFYNKALMKTLAHKLVVELLERVGNSDRPLSPNMYRIHRDLIFKAARVGNVEFLIILARSYPDLLWQKDEEQMSIFHYAISNRHEHVFNLIYEIGAKRDSLASFKNSTTGDNMLHLAGKLAPLDRLNIVSGAALQMQRELLWFEEIKKIVPRSFVSQKNSDKRTPMEVFIMSHEKLLKDGEKWMKDTANYCMLVATLIATVIFAAAFTVPGGNNQESGTPIFFRTNWLVIFFIADAVALCSSSSSIVFFLSILTSRYKEDNFLKSLPSKLLLGLATLFIAMVGMMVAFVATFFLLYKKARAWTPFVVIPLASIPIILFFWHHCKLWFDSLRLTCMSRFLFRPNKRRLF